MDDNKIQYLPKEIKNLKKLMFLDLSKNKFKILHNEIGNVFKYNLAVFVKSSSSLLNEDVTPGNFKKKIYSKIKI